MMDEMSIRSKLTWSHDKKKYIGFVDHGSAFDSETEEQASDALVFLVNAVNDHWKCPVAYYFTNKFSGVEKASVVRQILIQIHETGCKVISFTFDGASSNISMASELGANIRSTQMLKPYFEHPITKKPVNLFLDICHMLKLIRNHFESKKVLIDENGQYVGNI